MSKNSQFKDVVAVFSNLPKRRKRQFFPILFMMLLGGVAEFIALAAIVPFVSVMADPIGFMENYQGGRITSWLGNPDVERARLLLTVVFISIVLLAGAVRVCIIWITSKYSMMIGYDLSMRVYSIMLRQNYTFHLNNSTADLIAAMQKIHFFAMAVMAPIMRSITAVLTSIFVVAALLAINFTVAITTFAVVIGLYLLVTVAAQPLLKRNSVVIAAAQSDKVRLVQEGFGGIRDIIINALHPVYISRFGQAEYGFRKSSAINMLLSAAPKFVVETFLLLVGSLALFFLSTHVDSLTAALPTVTAFAFGLQRMLPYMQLVYRGKAQISANAASTSDLLGYLAIDIPNPPKSAVPIDFLDQISFNNVSFDYSETGDFAVRDINLSIKKGEFVGVMGPSGSGKSTLIDLFMGLQRPTQGTVEVDGKAIQDSAVPAWQKCIAHVSQSVFLIEGTIRENIALGQAPEEINEALLNDAIKIAELETFVQGLESGIETSVGERGGRLSGGQRQRIGLARAIYLDRDIIVLDEATSALDNETQEKVMTNIRAMTKKVTIVSVTHRLDTLQGCDVLVEMSQGAIERIVRT